MTVGEESYIKRNVKDTVFTNLFSDMKYLLQLYRCLHPEDTDITAEQITNVTLKPVMTNAIYNDLGFMVEDRLVLLVKHKAHGPRISLSAVFCISRRPIRTIYRTEIIRRAYTVQRKSASPVRNFI